MNVNSSVTGLLTCFQSQKAVNTGGGAGDWFHFGFWCFGWVFS